MMAGGTPIFRKADVATVSNNSEENMFFQGIPLIVGMITHTHTGWWFGCHFLFSH